MTSSVVVVPSGCSSDVSVADASFRVPMTLLKIALRSRNCSEEDETRRIADRQRLQQDRVEQREDGRVRADAERERQHRDGRERRMPRERAQRVADIARERIHPANQPRLARVFDHQRRIPHLAPRGEHGGLVAVAEALAILGEHVAMEVELLRHVAIDAPSRDEVAQLVRQARPHGLSPPA